MAETGLSEAKMRYCPQKCLNRIIKKSCTLTLFVENIAVLSDFEKSKRKRKRQNDDNVKEVITVAIFGNEKTAKILLGLFKRKGRKDAKIVLNTETRRHRDSVYMV